LSVHAGPLVAPTWCGAVPSSRSSSSAGSSPFGYASVVRIVSFMVMGLTACAGAPPPQTEPAPMAMAPMVPAPSSAREPSSSATGGVTPAVEPPRRVFAPPDEPVAPRADFGKCLRSRMCQFEGYCSPDANGQCIAQSNDDCRPSDACLGGRCTARDGVCIAGSEEDCRGSWACKGWGRCSHDGDDSCIATSQHDCQVSTRCQREGECTLQGDVCAP